MERESSMMCPKGAMHGDSKLRLLNYRLSQKLKLLGNGEFNHLTISLILPLTCGPKLSLNK